MKSTREFIGNYNLQQRENRNIQDYYLFNENKKYENNFPDFGINPGKKYDTILTHNKVFDKETNRNYNINFQQNVHKTPRKLKYVKFFNKNNIVVPEPLVIEHNQRPNLS
jgi:hypothetical protein